MNEVIKCTVLARMQKYADCSEKVLLFHLSQSAKNTSKASNYLVLTFVLGISRIRSNNISNYPATFTLTYESRPAHSEVTTVVTSFRTRQKFLYRELLCGLSLSLSSTSSSRLNRPCTRTGKDLCVHFRSQNHEVELL
jgi:hypothetical protein